MRRALGCVLVFLCLVVPWAAADEGAPSAGSAPPRVTLALNGESVPRALELLFRSAGVKYRLEATTVEGVVQLTLTDASLPAALRLLLRRSTPALEFRVEGGTYVIVPRTSPESGALQSAADLDTWALLLRGGQATLDRAGGELAVHVQSRRGASSVQLTHPPLRLDPKRWYVLHFRARSDQTAAISVTAGVVRGESPGGSTPGWAAYYSNMGYRLKVDTQSQEYRCLYQPAELLDGACPLTILLGAVPGKVWLSEISLKPGEAALQDLLTSLRRTVPPAWTPSDGRVLVRPVIFVPTGAAPRAAGLDELYFLHLRLAQQQYRELLLGRDTFGLTGPPVVVDGARDAAYYTQKFRERQLPVALLQEVLGHDRVSPIDCPYIYAILPIGVGGNRFQDQRGVVDGEGGPLGSRGAGSFYVLGGAGSMVSGSFQDVLQHEMGHTFGLPHTSDWGFSPFGTGSIMAGGRGRWTGFKAADPGRLLRVELQRLARNKAAFPDFALQPADLDRLPPDPPRPAN